MAYNPSYLRRSSFNRGSSFNKNSSFNRNSSFNGNSGGYRSSGYGYSPSYLRIDRRFDDEDEKFERFTSDYNKRLEDKISFFETKLDKREEEKEKRTKLDRVIDGLSIGNYAVAGGVKNIFDNDPNTTFFGGVKEGIKAGNPFGKDYKKGEVTFSDVFNEMGWKKQSNPTGRWYNPLSWNPNNVAHNLASFTADVVLDPLTYLSLGTTGLLRGTGRAGAKEITEQAVEGGLKQIAKGSGKEIIGDITQDMIKSDTRRLAKLAGGIVDEGKGLSFGIGKKRLTFVRDKTIREFSDKIGLSKMTQGLSDAFMNSKVGDLAKAFMPSHKLKELARENPMEALKVIKFGDFTRGLRGSLAEANQKTLGFVREIFDGVDEPTRKELTHILEDKNNYKTIQKKVTTSNLDEFLSHELDKMNKVESALRYDLKNKKEVFKRIPKPEYIEEIKKLESIVNEVSNMKVNLQNKTFTHLNAMNDLFVGKSDDFVRNTFNTFKNMNVYDIQNELNNLKTYTNHIPKNIDTQKMAYKVRHVIDSVNDEIPFAYKRYFKGQKVIDDVEVSKLVENITPDEIVKKVIDNPKSSVKQITKDIVNEKIMKLYDTKSGQLSFLPGMNKVKPSLKEVAMDFIGDLGDVPLKGQVNIDDILMRKDIDRVNKILDKPSKLTSEDEMIKKIIKDKRQVLPFEEVKKLPLDKKKEYTRYLLHGVDEKYKDVIPYIHKNASEYDINNILNSLHKGNVQDVERNLWTLTWRSKPVREYLANKYGKYNTLIKKLDDGTIELTDKAIMRNKELQQLVNMSEDEMKKFFKTTKIGEKGVISTKSQYLDDLKTGMRNNFADDVEALRPKNIERKVEYANKPTKDVSDLKDVLRQNLAEMRYGKKYDELLSSHQEEIEKILKNDYGVESFDGSKLVQKKVGKKIVNEYDMNGVKIYSPTNSSKEIEKVFGFLSTLPQSTKNLLAGTSIDASRVNLNGLLGVADTNTSKIMLDTSKANREVFLHEIGHLLDNGKSNRSLWHDAMKFDKEIAEAEIGKNFKEDFANSLKEYLTNNKKFSLTHPNRHAYLRDMFNNLKPNQEQVKLMEESYKNAKQFKMPKTAFEQLKWDIDFNKKSLKRDFDVVVRDGLNKGKNLETVEKEYMQITKDIENLKHFPEQYLKDKNLYNRYTYTIDEIEKLDKFSDLPIGEKEKRILKAIKTDFEKMGQSEVDLGVLKQMKDVYVYHLFNEEYIDKVARSMDKPNKVIKFGSGKMVNKSDLARKYEGSIKEINAYFKSKGIENFFEDDLSKIYLSRAIRHNKLVYDQMYSSHLTNMFGKELKEFALEPGTKAVVNTGHLKKYISELADSKKVQSQISGDVAKLGITENLLKKIESNGEPLLEVNADLFNKIKKFDPNIKVYQINDIIYENANKAGKIQFDKDTSAFLKVYDKFLRLWKLNVTAVIPGFHTRNLYSNNFNNFLDLGAQIANPKNHMETLKIMMNKSGKVKTRFGKSYTYDEIRKLANKLDVYDSGFFGSELGSHAYKTKVSIASRLNPLNDKHFIPYQAGAFIGGKIEGHARMLNFVENLKRGLSPYEALDHTNKFLFDYNDLTEFERQFMKRIIPFYTWARKNIPLQLEMMFTKPNYYRNMFKAQTNVEKQIDSKDRIGKDKLNQFAQDWIQLPGSVKNEDNRDEPIFWNPNMPYQDVSDIPEPTLDFAKTLFGKTSPAIKMPIELITNKNVFFEEDIRKSPDETKNVPGYMQAIYDIIEGEKYDNKGKKVKKQMSPELRHVLEQISSLEMLGEAYEKQGRDKQLHLLNSVGGVKLASYDVHKYNSYKLEQLLKQLQREAKERNKR